MISIDPRFGPSRVWTRKGKGKRGKKLEKREHEVWNEIKKLDVPCQLEHMEFGDAAFLSKSGPDGVPVSVGFEFKKVGDLISCIQDGRFAGHQLPGLLSCYGRVYLVVWGQYRRGKDGLLEVPKFQMGGMKIWGPPRMGPRIEPTPYSMVENWLETMTEKVGLRVRHCADAADVATFVASRYSWWCNRKYTEHKSHLTFHAQTDDRARAEIMQKPSLCRRWAKELDFIDWERSSWIERHFKTPHAMANAELSEWLKIPGIGKGIAGRSYRAIRGLKKLSS